MMNLLTGVIIVIVTAVVIGVILALGARGHGKLIRCPECGEVFKRPMFSERRSGIGVGIGPLGLLTCPKCRHREKVSAFEYVKE